MSRAAGAETHPVMSTRHRASRTTDAGSALHSPRGRCPPGAVEAHLHVWMSGMLAVGPRRRRRLPEGRPRWWASWGPDFTEKAVLAFPERWHQPRHRGAPGSQARDSTGWQTAHIRLPGRLSRWLVPRKGCLFCPWCLRVSLRSRGGVGGQGRMSRFVRRDLTKTVPHVHEGPRANGQRRLLWRGRGLSAAAAPFTSGLIQFESDGRLLSLKPCSLCGRTATLLRGAAPGSSSWSLVALGEHTPLHVSLRVLT